MTLCQRRTIDASIDCFNQLAASTSEAVTLALIMLVLMVMWAGLLLAITRYVFGP